MTLSDSLYQAALDELSDGHLALDRLGAPREFGIDDEIRELTIAERIKFVFPKDCDGPPCGECRLQPGEVCDICGRVNQQKP